MWGFVDHDMHLSMFTTFPGTITFKVCFISKSCLPCTISIYSCSLNGSVFGNSSLVHDAEGLIQTQAATFTVANLYYNHPILNILADDFNVSNERASQVPTLMQAGYASGLLLICPLGDVFRRRAFVLSLICFTATVVSTHLFLPEISLSILLRL